MFPIDDPVCTLDEVVNHHRDHRIVLPTNGRGINPGVDLYLKPVLESISTGIDIWCLIHQHTHRLMQVHQPGKLVFPTIVLTQFHCTSSLSNDNTHLTCPSCFIALIGPDVNHSP